MLKEFLSSASFERAVCATTLINWNCPDLEAGKTPRLICRIQAFFKAIFEGDPNLNYDAEKWSLIPLQRLSIFEKK